MFEWMFEILSECSEFLVDFPNSSECSEFRVDVPNFE